MRCNRVGNDRHYCLKRMSKVRSPYQLMAAETVQLNVQLFSHSCSYQYSYYNSVLVQLISYIKRCCYNYTQKSEKSAMAFKVSKTGPNTRTKHYFANPVIAIQENVTRSLYNCYLHFLIVSLSSCIVLYTHTNTLPYTSLAHAHPRMNDLQGA